MNIERIKTITLTFYFIFFVVIVRLFYIQIISHDKLSKLVIKQTYKTIEIPPKRGNIFNSHNHNIAYNKTYYQISLYKPNLKNPDLTIANLIQNPNFPQEDISSLNKFKNNNTQKWLTIKHLFSDTEIKTINTDNLDIKPVSQRQYLNPQLYSQVTTGLEKYYQKLLSGRYGFSYQNQDAVGKIIMSDKNWTLNPVDGTDLATSIDPIIQHHSYEILKKNLTKFNAKSGSIIVMQPNTGSILAMISLESSPSSTFKNPAITDLYEPGSIFKPLVMASALDNKSINSNWTCPKCNQPRIIGQYSIENWDKTVHPNTNLQDIIKNSDNIGMSYIISTLGQEAFLKYFSSLGINRKTGIDLQGEVKPNQKKYWPEIDFATASFGQGFSLTQIQMITAFNTLANQGSYQNPNISPINRNRPQKVFRPETVTEINRILRYAVNNSPVSQLNTLNLDVCAKSGTAQIATNGEYSDTEVVASYVGFFPCNSPKYTILVTLDRPQTSTWGSSTSAPIWFELALAINPLI